MRGVERIGYHKAEKCTPGESMFYKSPFDLTLFLRKGAFPE